VAELVRGDLGQRAAIPVRAAGEAVVEGNSTESNISERNTVNGLELEASAISADRKNTAAAGRIGNLVERIVELDATGATASVKSLRTGQPSGIDELERRSRHSVPRSHRIVNRAP